MKAHSTQPNQSTAPSLSQSDGFVSIMVAMIIMTLLMLIAVGFASLMRREQRQALDRELSTQAFYAAESGVNDAAKQVRDAIAAGTPLPSVTNCAGTRRDVDAARGVAYTCLLINSSPQSLEYDVGTDQSVIVPLVTSGANTISSITISWQDSDGVFRNVNDSAHGLAPLSGSSAGVLRGTFIPLGLGGTVPDRNTLINNSHTFFFYPNRAGVGTTTMGYSAANSGRFVDGGCTAAGTPKQCRSVINGFGAVNNMYLRLRAVYKPIKVNITAQNAGGGNVPLSGAQVVVDSTGKVSDVLRRVQVRVPITTTGNYPEFALESMTTICKKFVAWPGGATVDPSDPNCAL